MKSSWISSIAYKRIGDESYVAIFLKDRNEAMLYGGPESPIPSWMPGLLTAGTGRAYNKLLKGKFPYQKVEGRREVQKLKEMMK
jgi:hypothetical protein